MTGLDRWLNQATRHLSKDSAAQVKSEIQEHYESAREAAQNSGATANEADQMALNALGDARRANRQYRKVLLTSAEARLLREGNWEARMICSHSLVRRLARWIPVMAVLAAMVLFRAGAVDVARVLLAGAVGMGLLFIAPFLPVYTPSRSRMVRYAKWIVLAGLLVLAYWPDILKFSWLLIASLWPLAWVEWTRISIRRKLPVAQWPKHLYL
ncbi:MAG TPA: hypothetical protein VLW25_08890 [Bryobacteraceae bacterium]|nr:hypothetical protein [Bryobacteraceae bacterium]